MDVGYETTNYLMRILVDKKGKTYYGVINKITDVVEYEDQIFPRTLDAMYNLQELYDEAVKKETPALSVVKSVEKGDGIIH